MSDSRAVKNDFVNDFLNQGNLAKILDFIKDTSRKLILCFRGNSGQTITIYKKNHVFWEIKKFSRGRFRYRLCFNFNHARYSKEWKTYLNELEDLGWNCVSDLSDENKTNIGYLKYDFNFLDEDFLNRSYNIINSIFDDYFDSNKKFDFFSKHTKKNKSIMLEKQRQQEIFEQWSKPATSDGYLVYDLEFVEKGNKRGNQPDFWAVKYENGIPNKLVIGEVKSKESALTGKSGILEHLRSMLEYAKSTTMDKRREEAISILKSYATLELRGLTVSDSKVLSNITLGNDVEVLVVLTDEAAGVYDQAWEKSVLAIDSNIKIINFEGEDKQILDKSGFDNIILKNLIAKYGNDKFGYKVKDGRIYRNYYSNSEFNDFIAEMKSPQYVCHYKKYDGGLGKELGEKINSNGKYIPPKMAHVASSSRFCYLALRNSVEVIGGSGCIEFEKDCAVKGISGFSPQLDAFIAKDNIYIEAKCHEIFDKKETQMSISYWEYLYGNSNDIGFNLPVGKKPIGSEFEIPFKEFGFDDEWNRFDFKQFLCHLLGIASQEMPATLVYLFFKPSNEKMREDIDKVFDELKAEIQIAFSNKVIQSFCKEHQIKLKVVIEYSEVMEALSTDNMEVL